jgi:hypothetical protein
MSDFLLLGMLVGLIISLFHVAYLSRLVDSGRNSATIGTPRSRLTGGASVLNFAFWTAALWILLGAYVLGFWLIAIVFYSVFKAFRR